MKDNLVWSQRFVQNMRLRGQVTLMRSRKNDLKNSWALCRRWVESPCATTLVVGNQAINSNTTHQNFLMKIGTSRKQTLLVSELILGLISFHCFQSQPLATTWRMVCSTCSLYNYVLCLLSRVQTAATLLANSSQHCCMFHVASRLPTLIAQSLKLVNLLAPCKRTQHLLRAFASSVR